MQATGFSTGWIEYFLILIGGSGFLGMPGGHHDVSVRQAAPRQSLVYLEWSSRSSGKQGSPGFEGLMADPEIRPLLESFTDHIQAEDQIPAPGDNGNVFADFEDSRRQWLALVQQLTADPGCLFLSLEPPKKEVGGAGGFLKNALANVVGFQSRIRLGVVLSPQQHPDHLLDSISRMTDADIGPNPDMKVVSFKNPAYTITVHQIGQRIILGYGNGTVTAVMECLEGRAPSIESNPRFQESVKRLQLANTSNVGWIDVHETVQTAVRLVGPAGALIPIVLRATSLDVLDSITSTSGIVDGDIIQRVYLSTGGTTSGLFALAGGPALGSEQLSHIPSDCDLVLAGSVDLGKVIHSVRDLLYQVTPVSAKVFDEAIKQMEGELGLKLDADILQALGTTLTLFDSPTYGGTLGSSAILAVEVRDPGRAALIYERFLSHLEQSFVDRSNGGDRQTSGLSPDYEIRQQSFAGTSISCLQAVGPNSSRCPSVSPAFCLTEKHILVSLHAQALKSHLRFLANRPARTDFSLLKGLSNSSGQIINFGRLDGKKALQTVCTLGPFFSPAIERQCLRMGIPIHSFSIPSATAILPYARDASFVVLRQNQGILIEMRNSHVALLTGAVLGAIHSSLGENDLYPMPSSAGPDAEITLGPVEGDVRQAKAENEVKPEAKERPAAKAARTIAPLILKALVPDELRQLVPNDAIEKLQQPPTPEQQQQKIERRKLIEERRQRRMERRRPAPAP